MTNAQLDRRTDAELISAVRSGQRVAYAGLVRRYQDGLYRHARAMGLDHDTGLDLVQETFVKAYTRLDDCRDPNRFRFWLHRVSRNLCLDYLKNVRRRTVPLSTLADADSIAEANGANCELSITLQAVLEQLPIAMREAFLLKHEAGYTYEEVAELTNASPSAVKMRVHRAREALQALLAEQGIRAA